MISRQSSTLSLLLDQVRQHPAFPELLKAVQAPALPQFRASQAAEVEKARAEWIFSSGKKQQHDMWLALLTGKPPKENYD
jgi:hypothetical protein